MRISAVHAAVIIFIAAVGLSGACTKKENEAKPPQEQKAEAPAEKPAKPKQRSAPAKRRSRQKTTKMDPRARYEAFAGVRVRDYGGRVADLERSAARATGRYRGRIESRVRTLGYRYADVKKAYRRLTSASEASWKAAKREMDAALNRFDTYYSRVASD